MYPIQPHHITPSYSTWNYIDLTHFVVSMNPQCLTSSGLLIENFGPVVDLLKKQEEEILSFSHGQSILQRFPADPGNPLFYFQRERWLEAYNKIQFWKHLPGGAEFLKPEVIDGSEERLARQLEEWMLTNPAVRNLRGLQIRITQDMMTRLPPEIGLCKELRGFIMVNTLMQELPSQFGELVNLQVLFLSNNRLRRLCPEFQNLQSLERLELTNNRLEDIDPTASLRNLECLYVSNNQIQRLPSTLYWEKLRSLDLGKNQIRELPESFYNLTGLTLVCLDKNQLSAISEKISQFSGLDSLFLDRNQLTSLPSSLGKMVKLRCICFTHNLISEIPLSLLEAPSLIEITFQGNPLSYRPAFLPPRIWTDIK